jgi:Sulfotransferase family
MYETLSLGADLQTRSADLLERRECNTVLVVLAPPRSYASIVGAMLGQHPDLYGLPETHLFTSETVGGWLSLSFQETFNMSHGLLRAVAQLWFGGQSENHIVRAQGWLRRRSHLTTGHLVEQLAALVSPRILVEKSPSIVYRQESLQRTMSMFPEARFIHLLQHPRSYAKSVISALRDAEAHGPVPQWLLNLASGRNLATDQIGAEGDLDPQRAWFTLHKNIRDFLESVPGDQKLLLRVEDLFASPEQSLQSIVTWLGLRSDPAAIEAMKHPELSPYACLGPANAAYGDDYFFLSNPNPTFGAHRAESLEGPLPWRSDEIGFCTEVRNVANEFGYS